MVASGLALPGWVHPQIGNMMRLGIASAPTDDDTVHFGNDNITGRRLGEVLEFAPHPLDDMEIEI